jgi:hypothetical protein
MLSFPTVLLLALGARADEPPTWSEDAVLMVSETLADYSGIPMSDREREVLAKRVDLALHWFAARDDQGIERYELYQGEELRARLGRDTLSWETLAEPEPATWAVVAVDSAGQRSPPLEGTMARLRPAVSHEDGVMSITVIGPSGGALEGEVGGLFSEGTLLDSETIESNEP